MPMRLRTKKGFSILELIVTVSIIIITMFTVVASFWRSQQKAIGSAALANLDHIRTAQTLFHAENQTFTNNEAALSAYVPFVKSTDPAPEWSYAITADGASFVAVATRVNTRPFAGFTITLSVDSALAGSGAQTSSIVYRRNGGGLVDSYPPP